MSTYIRQRCPLDIIIQTVWLCYRFNLSHCDSEDALAKRGITVSYAAIRLWRIKSAAIYTRVLKRKHRGFGDTSYINEVVMKINGNSITCGGP
jgi:putative transposase